MKQKLTEIKKLFENEDYKAALFSSLELTREIQNIQLSKGSLTEEETEIIKESLRIQTFSLIEVIALYNSYIDNILQSAEMMASRITVAEELVLFFNETYKRINQRFVDLLPVIDTVEKEAYVQTNNFFYGDYGNLQLRLKRCMLLRLRDIDPNAPHECSSHLSYEEYYQFYELNWFKRGASYHDEFISLIPDFPVFHYSDIHTIGSYLPKCLWAIERSIPEEDDEKKRYPSIFVPRMKEYINFLVNYLNVYTMADNGTRVSLISSLDTRNEYYNDIKTMEARIQKYEPNYTHPPVDVEGYCLNDNGNSSNSGGCYVATAVYGSYDCPEVWTLRRYRDNILAGTWYGRAFIKTYYAISPTLVKWFGHTEWFKKMWKGKLDSMVKKLQSNGVESTPYKDRSW